MRRRALRPSFVVTFALGAAAMAAGCSNPPPPSSGRSVGDGAVGDGGCPAVQPETETPCDLPSSLSCTYIDSCFGRQQPHTAMCQQGMWSVSNLTCPDAASE